MSYSSTHIAYRSMFATYFTNMLMWLAADASLLRFGALIRMLTQIYVEESIGSPDLLYNRVFMLFRYVSIQHLF